MTTPFAKKLVDLTEDQYNRFRFYSEDDPPLAPQIKKYWKDLGLAFPGVGTPWSAVFVSWCVLKAGASAAEFKFSPQHSVFVYHAIDNARNNRGLFRAYDVTSYSPELGDIIQNNRGGNDYDYNYAASHSDYSSHSAIVIERGVDSGGGYVMTVGGNESDSIRQKLVRLNNKGFIRQRDSNPFICVIQTLK